MRSNRRIAYRGCLMALALVLSYVESLFPVFAAVPGIRIGLSNIVTVYTLYRLSAADACFVTTGRIILSAMLFGNVTTMIYSFAGAFFSIGVMILARPIPGLSSMGVSVLGGLFHNLGQVAAAAFLFSTGGLFRILTVLLPVGAAAGAVIGILAGVLIRRVPLGEEPDEEAEEFPEEEPGEEAEEFPEEEPDEEAEEFPEEEPGEEAEEFPEEEPDEETENRQKE